MKIDFDRELRIIQVLKAYREIDRANRALLARSEHGNEKAAGCCESSTEARN